VLHEAQRPVDRARDELNAIIERPPHSRLFAFLLSGGESRSDFESGALEPVPRKGDRDAIRLSGCIAWRHAFHVELAARRVERIVQMARAARRLTEPSGDIGIWTFFEGRRHQRQGNQERAN